MLRAVAALGVGGLTIPFGRRRLGAEELGNDIVGHLVCPSKSSGVRKTEASIIELRDGRLLLAYSDFYTVSSDDAAPARISGRYSSDMGKSWTEPFTIIQNTAKKNVMSVSMLRLNSGEIALAYLYNESDEDGAVLFRTSRDEARTFSEPIKVSPRKSVWVMNNDRLVQLSSGRLLAPCQRLDDFPTVTHSLTEVLYSDDGGKTWGESSSVDIRKNHDGADEPGVVELKDGRILMFFRTALGAIYQSFSSDRGISWTEPEPMKLEAPMSPSLIKRIPSTGDLLIVWNHSLPHAHDNVQKDRFPLSSAISRDEARTWENIRDFETDARYTYAYPSITFLKDRVLISYWQCSGEWWFGLKVFSAPVRWFYEHENLR